ncbi:hypothetical protein J6590_045536 [Homalodisca vitripennis]|nr:hypothetical protein J6590_045536 [Homalodisca vitripennis]
MLVEQSKSGKPLILYNNYKCRESHCLKNGEKAWRCLGGKCGATRQTSRAPPGHHEELIPVASVRPVYGVFRGTRLRLDACFLVGATTLELLIPTCFLVTYSQRQLKADHR